MAEEETFMQRVRRLCQAQEEKYNQDRSAWYQPEHRHLVQLCGQKRITRQQEDYYHYLLNCMEQLTFQQMLAARTGNARQTVAKIVGQANDRVRDDELPRWGTVDSILHASKVDPMERWLLNFLYQESELKGAKKVPSTTEQLAFRQPESPTTDPIGPFPGKTRTRVERLKEPLNG